MKAFREQAKKDHEGKLARMAGGGSSQDKLSGAHGTLGNPGGNDLASMESAPGTKPYETPEGKATPTRAVQVPMKSSKSKQNLGKYARGGKVKGKKGDTHVNIMIGHPGQPPGMATPIQPNMMPQHPPMAPPGMAGAPPGLPPGGPPPGMGMPPMSGAMMKPPGMKRGGGVMGNPNVVTLAHEGLKAPKRARGGKTVHMTAGAVSGPGRIQKIKAYGKNAHMPAKAV